MPTVELVGSGPAAESIDAALSDTSATVRPADEPLQTAADLAVVVGAVTDDRFPTAGERARELDVPWVAVELGGMGGVPVVDAAVSGFGPGSGCFHCLAARVRANLDDEQRAGEPPDSGLQRFAGAVAGRRVQGALSGTGPLAGTVVELPYAERQFLPVPGCACGGSRSWLPTRGEPPSHEREALARAEAGLDERVGVVSEVGETESFPAPYYLASVASTEGFSDAVASRQAAGVAGDWDTAFMKALGESYERYAAGVYRTEAMVSGTADGVSDPVPPSAFVRPDDDAPDGGERKWVPAEHLGTGETYHLPAETVLYPPPSRDVRPPVTTGLGLGGSERDALLSGLYEVVERDAAMLSWYSTYEPLGLRVESVPEFDELRRRARSESLSVTPLLLTQDVDVPVVAVALERDEWPAVALGSAADVDPAEAATGALEEALQNWMELRGMGPDEAAEADGAIGHYAARPEEIGSFTTPETTVPLASVGSETVPEGDDELPALVDRATAGGLAPYATRLTTRDIERMGFEAVRVVAPSAQPLFFGESFFGERARRVPADLGFEARPDRAHHPFP
jgi:ribosomal protein S12 methylthiotransferase accessory factor